MEKLDGVANTLYVPNYMGEFMCQKNFQNIFMMKWH